MNALEEYRRLSYKELELKLAELIKMYNKLRNCTMLIYAASTESPFPEAGLIQKDFYNIKDILDQCKEKNDTLEIYLETPGGRGETAEEIVKYIRKKFKMVNFVICGEAKSAGTILAMSGDEILMTDTGSLGPIDAQIVVGRSRVSAYDYTNWIEKKRKEAEQSGLNQVDIAILAQISPGELEGAVNSQEYAVEMVKEWLVKYKFKNWKETETTKQKVTDEMKYERAKEIAEALNNHKRWKTHARSLKKEDLENLKLKIVDVEQNEELKDIIYRIHTISRLMFMSGNVYKIIMTKDNGLSHTVTPLTNQPNIPEVVEINAQCNNCGYNHHLYLKLKDNKQIDTEASKKGLQKFPENNILKCKCGSELNLSNIRNDIEAEFGIKTVD